MQTQFVNLVRRTAMAFAVVATALIFTASARADLPKKVIAHFKGQLVATTAEVAPAEDDAAWIKAIDAARITELKASGDKWTFRYMAFLKYTGASELRLEFRKKDGDVLVADKTFSGIDPKITVISGEVSMTENDGLLAGTDYTVRLTGSVKGKTAVFATTSLSTAK